MASNWFSDNSPHIIEGGSPMTGDYTGSIPSTWRTMRAGGDGGNGPAPNPTTPTTNPTVPGIPNFDPNKPILGQIGVPTPQSGQSYGYNAFDQGGTWNGNTFTPANGDWQAWFNNLVAKQPPGQRTLQSLKDTLARYGVQITPPNASGDTTKIGLPDGRWVRVIEGDPNSGSWTWVVQPKDGGGSGAGAPGQNGNYTFDYPSWNETFSFDQFKPPTGLTEDNDPGFQERLKLGTDALQRSAAAQGTVLDTGTLKDLNAFAQNFASNEFQNVYARDANTYLTQYNSAADQYNQRYQQYLNGYQNALNTFNTNFGVDTSLWNRAFAENNQGFAQQLSLADLGLSASGQSANAGAAYGNAAGNYLSAIGNANAAGSVANGNIWGNLAGNLANYGSQYWAGSRMPRGYLPSTQTAPNYSSWMPA